MRYTQDWLRARQQTIIHGRESGPSSHSCTDYPALSGCGKATGACETVPGSCGIALVRDPVRSMGICSGPGVHANRFHSAVFRRSGLRDTWWNNEWATKISKNLRDSQSYFKSGFCKGLGFLCYKGEMTKQSSLNYHCYYDFTYSHGLEGWWNLVMVILHS